MDLISDLPATVASHSPNHTAFRCEGESLSYAQLLARSNQLAGCLVGAGVQPGDPVAIYMPRCLESAVAVYGILKAGAVFVPLDPTTPGAALSQLFADCGIRVLITHPSMRRLLRKLPAEPALLQTVIGLNTELTGVAAQMSWPEVWQARPVQPGPTLTPDAPAYVIHTSGSTGKPKGIVHSHRSGLAYARLSADTYAIEPADVIASHAPLHTDMSTLGYLTGPYAGATTVIVPEATTRMPASLVALLAQEQISIWYSVPLALVQMLDSQQLPHTDASRLRWILYGGEAFAARHLRALAEQLPAARISNVYGPAEVNQCTFYHLPQDWAGSPAARAGDAVPIGKVWAETRALVVDEADQPVACGQTGELLIASSTAMTAYWGQPAQTEQAFFTDGSQTVPRRYYRTGDLVRQGEDGLLYLAGRRSRQAKVRGFRVELDGVELALAEYPGVAEAGVISMFVEQQNTNMLIAAVTTTDPAVTATDLDEHARQVLPAAAVPAHIYVLGELPRTTSGKIDRQQLYTHYKLQQTGTSS